MRTIVLTTTLIAALAASATPAKAWRAWHPWCAWLANGIEAGSCAYDTLAQCVATVRGAGGYCGINPYPPPPPPPVRRSKRAYYR